MKKTVEFIIIEHKAHKAGQHTDLRFENPDGPKWISFAIPKGFPLKEGGKVIAIKTKLHSRREALYVGEIPRGSYGAGTLKKFDGGKAIVHIYKPNHIALEFKGSKVKGIYHLISMEQIRKYGDKNNFLLFKGKLENLNKKNK